ncbi:dolichol kinase [Linderina pennispora]|nr:dolichol kinase [Linderina pennispora]
MGACVALLASIPLYIKHNSYQLATGPDHHDKVTDTVVLPGTTGAMYRPAADDGVVWGACLLPLVLSAKAIDQTAEIEPRGLSVGFAIAVAVAMSTAFAVSSLSAFLQQRRGEQVRWTPLVYVSWAAIAVAADWNGLSVGLVAILLAVVAQSLVTVYVARSLAKSFTLGEAAVVAQTVVLVAMDFAARVWSSGKPYEDIGVVCLEAAVLGLLAMARVLASAFTEPASVIGSHRPVDNSSMAAVAKFAGIVGMFGSASLVSVAYIARVNPVGWVLQMVLGSTDHLLTIAYWVGLLIVGGGVYALAANTMAFGSRQSKLALHVKRKSYHLLATLMFVPGFLAAPQLLHLGFTVALVGFVLVECVRLFGIGPLASPMRDFFANFVDHRDAGCLVTSHFYLLFGCALPVWLGGSSPVACLAGVLSLGVGDAVASLVGMRLGRVRWPGSPKTIEGTAGFVLSMFAAIQLIRARLDGPSSAGGLSFLLLSAVAGVLEAFTEQNDNLVIPLFMYAGAHAMSTGAGLDIVRLGPASLVAFAVVLPDVIDAAKQHSITGLASSQ